MRSDLWRRHAFVLRLLVLAAAVCPVARAGEAPAKAELILLDTESFWRCHLTWGTDLARLKSGELAPMHPHSTTQRVYKDVDGKKKRFQELRAHDKARCWSLPPTDWAGADFADGSWARLKGPFCIGPYGSRKRSYRSTPLVCLRGKFRVGDPARVGALTMSLSYLGGMVVYVNGKELTRAQLPDGKLAPTTPASDYPTEAFFDAEGRLWDWDAQRKDPKARKAFETRLRSLSVRVPAAMLRKGVNVLALENHRAPAPETFFYGRSKQYPNLQHVKAFCWWSRVGVKSVGLVAAKGAPAMPNAGHTGRPGGFQVWTQPIHQQVSAGDYADACESIQPVRLCGARNGVHSGQVVAGSDRPIRGLKAEVSELRGPGVIPAGAVQVRYALCDVALRRGGPAFDGLEEFPPVEVPLYKGRHGTPVYGAVQPIWLTVRIPASAKPGNYRATVTVRADGQEPVQVPLELRVVDWVTPDSKEFFAHLGLWQSPDSLAMQYGVAMWSDKHWQLLDRTFRLLGEAGNKVVWITAQRKTHFGNEHAMIRWIKDPDGGLKPDLSIAEKYLDLAVKHQGRVPVVALYCWRAPWVTGHFGHHKAGDRKILLSVVDPDTGELQKTEGPEWGKPECVKLWKPVFDGMKDIVKKRGIPAESLMIGTAGDYEPTDTALEALKAASGGLRWVFHSHVVRHTLGSKRDHFTGYIADGWGGHCHHVDPEFGRGYGWKNSFRRAQTRGFPRHTAMQRLHLESLVTARIIRRKADDQPDYGLHGMGRVGADFWPVLGDRHGRKSPLAGRYLETAWGQLGLRCCGLAVLAPGKHGAIGTVRLEMFRENSQEIEARVFIEKALHDPARKAKVGEELAARALAVLDERVRACNRAGHYRETLASGIQERSAKLYQFAAEVAAALGER